MKDNYDNQTVDMFPSIKRYKVESYHSYGAFFVVYASSIGQAETLAERLFDGDCYVSEFTPEELQAL